MDKKRLVLPFVNVNSVSLGKDVFLVPYWYGKINGLDVEIVYPDFKDNDLPLLHRGVKLTPLSFKTNYSTSSFKGEWFFFLYILKHSPKIDVLMRFHFSYNSWIIGLIYKLRNPRGVFFTKGDDYGLFKSLYRDEKNKIIKFKNNIIRKILHSQCNLSDIITVDNSYFYDELKNGVFGFKIGDKLENIINAFDEELLQELDLPIKAFERKENLMITVGRLGTWQKNTELFLEAIEMVELSNWKIALIGPIDPDFEKYIEQYFSKRPDLKEKVKFTGQILDKKDLWEWYNRAKVFVLSSRLEGFAVVYMEAIRFSNYIITTDVGGSKDSLKIGHGEFIEQNDKSLLAKRIQAIIDGEVPLSDILNEKPVDPYRISWEHEIRKLKK